MLPRLVIQETLLKLSLFRESLLHLLSLASKKLLQILLGVDLPQPRAIRLERLRIPHRIVDIDRIWFLGSARLDSWFEDLIFQIWEDLGHLGDEQATEGNDLNLGRVYRRGIRNGALVGIQNLRHVLLEPRERLPRVALLVFALGVVDARSVIVVGHRGCECAV